MSRKKWLKENQSNIFIGLRVTILLSCLFLLVVAILGLAGSDGRNNQVELGQLGDAHNNTGVKWIVQSIATLLIAILGIAVIIKLNFYAIATFSVFIFFVMCFGIAAAVAVGNNYNLFLSLFRAEHYRDDGFQNEFLRYRVDLERWRIGRNLFGLYYDLTVSLAFFEALSFVSSLMLCYMLYIIGEGPSFFGFRFGYTSGDVTPAKRSTVQSLSTLT